MNATFTGLYCSVAACLSGDPVVDNKCGDAPADRIELEILHSPNCTTMGDGCEFDYIADLRVNGISVGRIEVQDQKVAQLLLLAVKPMFSYRSVDGYTLVPNEALEAAKAASEAAEGVLSAKMPKSIREQGQ